MKRTWLFILLVFLLAPRTYAFDVIGLQPVAPYGVISTFSTESVPKNKWAFEVGAERSRDPNFYRLDLKGAYGITKSLEFDIMVPYVLHFEGSADGMEDISIGLKHRFYDEGKYGPSLAYILTASLNNGRDEFSTGGSYGLGVILSKRVGPFTGHMNFFYMKPGTARLEDEITVLGGVEFAASHNIKLLAEMFTKKSYFSSTYDKVEARFGYRMQTTDYLYTTIAAGTDFKRRSPEYRVLVSVSFSPPREKKKIKKVYEEE